jgi:signal transduction histidine kinase
MNFFSRKGLTFRLLSTFVFIIVIVLTVQTVVYILRAQKRIHGELVREGVLRIDLLAYSSRIAVFTENKERLQEDAAGVQTERDVVLVGFYGSKLNPLYVMSSTDRYHLSSDIDIGVAAAIKPGGTLTREEKDTVEFIKPVVLLVNPDATSLYFGDTGADRAARIIGYVRIVMTKEPLKRQMKNMLLTNAITGLIFIGMTIAMGFLLVKRIARPIEMLTERVKALGRGGEAVQVPVETMDEIGRLATAFNTMLVERRDAERSLQKVLMDIHDGIGGITTNISLLSEIARKGGPGEAQKAVATISSLAREGMGEIRSLMYSLDREDMTWHSLSVEIRNQGMKLVEPHSIAFEMTSEISGAGPEPGSLLCLSLFRIYRESLMNVIKHAKAKKVSVVFRVNRERLILAVCDDGVGLDEPPLSGKGRGMSSMKTRAAEIGGTVTITSGRGACVSLELPLAE